MLHSQVLDIEHLQCIFFFNVSYLQSSNTFTVATISSISLFLITES